MAITIVQTNNYLEPGLQITRYTPEHLSHARQGIFYDNPSLTPFDEEHAIQNMLRDV